MVMLFYITALAVMQDFQDKEKKPLRMNACRHFKFYFCTIFHGLSLCDTLHFVLHSWSSYYVLSLSYINITKLPKFKMTAKRSFLNRLLPKAHQVNVK